MKRVWLLMSLILVVSVQAYLVLDTGEQGKNPAIYGDNFVFESDGKIKIYNTNEQALKVVDEGTNPGIFAYKIVYQSNNGKQDLVKVADVRNLQSKNINVGRNPAIYSDTIAFSAKESELQADIDGDDSLNDNIILYYDLANDKLVNTNAVGDFPTVSKSIIVFETSEQEFGGDLNGDGDTNDVVIRSYDYKNGGLSNNGILGSHPDVSEDGIAVFRSEGEIDVFDLYANKLTRTKLQGLDPSIYGRVVMFSSDGKLASYDLDTSSYALLDVPGEQPDLFDLAVVFTANGKVRFLKSQDLDEDGVVDIVDNCPQSKNVNQSDSNYDGIGDECDDHVVVIAESKAMQDEEPSKQTTETSPLGGEGDESHFFWWVVCIVAIALFVRWCYPKWSKKKRKSFGF